MTRIAIHSIDRVSSLIIGEHSAIIYLSDLRINTLREKDSAQGEVNGSTQYAGQYCMKEKVNVFNALVTRSIQLFTLQHTKWTINRE